VFPAFRPAVNQMILTLSKILGYHQIFGITSTWWWRQHIPLKFRCLRGAIHSTKSMKTVVSRVASKTQG